MLEANDYDAIVVGSGMSGGWAAKELTERGLRTLVLEAGGPIDPGKDYVEHVQPWQMHFRGFGNRKELERDQPIQSRCYACDELGHKFFVKDAENPYTTPADAPFNWLRGRQVGGRSIMWGRQVYRWSDLDFEANLKDGHGNDWPIRYRDIEPWYAHVERFIGVSGRREGLSQLPDGVFLPPMQMTAVEADARPKILKAFGGERVLTIGRCAILTQNHRGRLACHYCGPCERGCITNSYFSSIAATLPAARATGRLTLRPNSVVAEVLYDAKKGRARGVRVIDALTRRETEYTRAHRFSMRIHHRVGSPVAEFEERRIPRRPRQLERYARQVRHGPQLWLRRVRVISGFRRQAHHRQPSQRHLHRTLPECQKPASRFRARVCVPGLFGSVWLGARSMDAGSWREVQAIIDRRAWRLVFLRVGFW